MNPTVTHVHILATLLENMWPYHSTYHPFFYRFQQTHHSGFMVSLVVLSSGWSCMAKNTTQGPPKLVLVVTWCYCKWGFFIK